jgi:hypothetical protein
MDDNKKKSCTYSFMGGPPLYFYSRQLQAVASAREGYLRAQRKIFSWT